MAKDTIKMSFRLGQDAKGVLTNKICSNDCVDENVFSLLSLVGMALLELGVIIECDGI